MATANDSMIVAQQALTKIDQHLVDCQTREDRRRVDYADIKKAIETAAATQAGLVGSVHKRVDQLHLYALSTVGAGVLLLLGVVGYLLTDGAPWQTPLAGMVSSAQASDEAPPP